MNGYSFILIGFAFALAGQSVLGSIQKEIGHLPVPFIACMFALAILLVVAGVVMVIVGLTNVWPS